MTDLRTPTALLFDMDGTLVDSTALVENTWGDFAETHGLDLADVLAFAHGRPTAATVHHFLPDPDVAARETARLVAYEESTTDGVREIPGARSVLTALPAHSWAIVTSASRTLARNRMRAAGLPLPGILVSADDIVRGKPDPEGYLLAAAALGADITAATVFEDSPAGVRAGRASGARTVVIGALTDFDAELERFPDFTAPALVAALLGAPAQAGRP
ncbi:HAD-IA family hydrolase [Tsukamurella ocularis]|uniref:HAD-IA family hydrolase n=1 Tax=Tsukamurella ocularis TaxID=1970234 RepID=UPI00216A8269|nr:HAD-IA family hydrolase [Tsukamurella ocularis]MCS3780015.1 sugar-phosphatase [Tsukamurella ocularis]MCS3788585.1 sugar-phosphatase [Tsukamurella ocularis]MCS3849795.1 sugar-phosphatase [Tsukamurella ocularis]